MSDSCAHTFVDVTSDDKFRHIGWHLFDCFISPDNESLRINDRIENRTNDDDTNSPPITKSEYCRRAKPTTNLNCRYLSNILSFSTHSNSQNAGQKTQDAVLCKKCGMAYFPHSEEDNAAHTKYHKYSTSAIRLRVSGYLKRKFENNPISFENVKHQNILKQFLDGSIYLISHSSSSMEQKKAEHVREAIDTELGITTPFNCLWNETKVSDADKTLTKKYSPPPLFSGLFLHRRFNGYCSWLLSSSYCSSRELLFICCFLECLFKVHVLDLNDEANIDTQTEMDKMLCGVARIWVHPDHRRGRIATKLLDCVR